MLVIDCMRNNENNFDRHFVGRNWFANLLHILSTFMYVKIIHKMEYNSNLFRCSFPSHMFMFMFILYAWRYDVVHVHVKVCMRSYLLAFGLWIYDRSMGNKICEKADAHDLHQLKLSFFKKKWHQPRAKAPPNWTPIQNWTMWDFRVNLWTHLYFIDNFYFLFLFFFASNAKRNFVNYL